MALQFFAQDYDYSTELTTTDAETGGLIAAIFGGGFLIFWLLIGLAFIIAMWKIFVKAGKPGWAAIVPIYNVYILLQIVGRPVWWLVLFLIPFVNFLVSLVVAADLAKKFGKDPIVWGVILSGLLGIGYLIIGFDKSKYDPNAELSLKI
jgi:hypothetical protein